MRLINEYPMDNIDVFTMKDGRKVSVDFMNVKSILSVKKKDWMEIGKKLNKRFEELCSQMSGKEVYLLLKPNLKWKY